MVKVVDCSADLKKIFTKKIATELEIAEENIIFIDEDEKF